MAADRVSAVELELAVSAVSIQEAGSGDVRSMQAADDIHAAATWEKRDGDDQIYGLAATPRSGAERNHRQL